MPDSPKSKKQLLAKIIERYVIKHEYDPNPHREVKDGWIFDFREIILNPDYLEVITHLLYEKIADRDNFQIGGLESAAIPLVTALTLKARAEEKNVNGFYVRKSRKKTGLYKQIEGNLNDNPIILVDDLMNQSSSKIRQIELLETLGKTVDTVLTIVTYRPFEEYEYLEEHEVNIKTIFTLEEFDLSPNTTSSAIKNSPYQKKLLYDPEIASYMHVVPKSVPVIQDNYIFFGTDAGKFLALDKQSGAEVWSLQTGLHTQAKNIFSSPAIYNDTVFFGSYDGKCYALDTQYGAVKWIFAECDWIGSSPAICPAHNLLYIGLEHGLHGKHGSIVALDVTTGEKKWEVLSGAYTHASPTYVERHDLVYCGGNDGRLRAIQAKTGEVSWQFETIGGATYDGQSGFSRGDIKLKPVYDEETDSIAFGATDGWMYVLDATTGSLKFKAHTEYPDTSVRAGIYSQPLWTDASILFTGTDKTVYCHDKRTGEKKWSYQTAGRIFASPVNVAGSIFVGSNDGRLYEFSETDGQVLSQTQFTERITNPVVYDHEFHQLFITTQTNQLFVLELPMKQT